MIPSDLKKSESLRRMVGQMILAGFQGKIFFSKIIENMVSRKFVEICNKHFDFFTSK